MGLVYKRNFLINVSYLEHEKAFHRKTVTPKYLKLKCNKFVVCENLSIKLCRRKRTTTKNDIQTSIELTYLCRPLDHFNKKQRGRSRVATVFYYEVPMFRNVSFAHVKRIKCQI